MRHLRVILAVAALLTGAPLAAQTPVDVSVGDTLGCALHDTGEVWCWGQVLGHLAEPPYTAWKVEGLPPARALDVGSHGACAATRSREAWCWGIDLAASIRAVDAVIAEVPVKIEGLPEVSAVTAGHTHQCALGWHGGEVWCWGANPCGELGCGDTRDRAEPVRVPFVTDAIALGAGTGSTCAVMIDGAVSCWGSDDPAGLNDGEGFVFASTSPLLFDPDEIGRFRKVANGRNFACGLREDGRVTCWGANILGQIGTDAPRMGNRYSAIGEVDGLAEVGDLDAADYNACATTGGAVRCWGIAPMYAADPVLGFPTETVRPVSGLAEATRIGVGEHFACALEAGRVLCWGAIAEDGTELLPGMRPDRAVPVPGLPGEAGS